MSEALEADANLKEIERLRAHLAVLIETLEERHTCANCGGKGSYWVDVNGEAEHEVCDCWIRADHVLYHDEHPGTSLLAEIRAARAVVAQVRWAVENHYAPPPMYDALAAYDEARKARGE